MEQQKEVYFWPFSSDMNEAMQIDRESQSHVQGIILREECTNELSSVTDLCKGILGTPTRDTGLLGEMEGGRQVTKMLLINQP